MNVLRILTLCCVGIALSISPAAVAQSAKSPEKPSQGAEKGKPKAPPSKAPAKKLGTEKGSLSPKSFAAVKKAANSLSSDKQKKLLEMINKGAKEEILEFPGVNKATAENIQKARPFKNVADLAKVAGIGEKKFLTIVKSFK